MREDDGGVEFSALLHQIHHARGFDCEAYKQSCLRRRVAVRMRARGAHTYEEYRRILSGDTGEYDRLLDALTINVSKFFRNAETWEVLEHRVLPVLWQQGGGSIRCWSAGCAGGEEPYTLAILLLEVARRLHGRIEGWAIDATDLDRESLRRAAEASYRAPAFEEMPATLRGRYTDGADPARLAPEVTALVRLRQHDLLRDPPPQPPYDLILCRNVVIYFDRDRQERLFNRFVEALRPGGFLILGRVETLVGVARDRLTLEDPRERVYRRP